MVRQEGVGDWWLLGSEDIVSTKGARYTVEIHETGESGLLRVDSSAGAPRIELRLSWPSSERGSLLVGETRQALARPPEVVTVEVGGSDGPQKMSGFSLVVLPDEPTRKVLPYREMIIALNDDGALAQRINANNESPSALPADREELQRLLCEHLAQRYPDPQIEVSDGRIAFTDARGGRQRLALDNAWARVRAGERNVVESLCRSFEEGDGQSAEPAIFPLIKAAGTAEAFFTQAKQMAKREGGTPEPLVSVPFAPGLECLFVRDLPKGMSFISGPELRAAKLEEQALPAYAAQRLSGFLSTILRVDVEPGVYLLTCGGNYETGLLLLPEVWAELDPLLQGARVVAIPNRDLLFVTGAENASGIAWMRKQAAGSAERSYPITTDLLRWNGTGYEVLDPPKRSWLKRLFS
jgi:hypothetical protein